MTEELVPQIDRMAARIADGLERAARRMAAEIAAAVMTEAKLNAPVDTGRLRDSLTPGTADNVETVLDEGGAIAFEVGTNVEYAIPVEYGTPKRAATPYMGPALESVRAKVPEYARGIIQEELAK